MRGLEVLGTGRYLPQKAVDNTDFTSIVETSDEWIAGRTGMKRRYIASAAEPTWYMGAQAAKAALEAAGLSAADMDMILVSTVSPDYETPSTACMIQREIGAANAFAVDVNVACTGFAFALDMARRYLATGDVEHVLVVGAETLSQMTNYADRSTCVLFGDGAGACVAKGSDKRFASYMRSDAAGTHLIYSKKPRKSNPLLDDTEPLEPFPIECRDGIFMNGREVYKFATKIMPQAVRKACEKLEVAVTDLALIVPHQANARIIETAVKSLGIAAEKVYVNIEKYGNTSSASVAIALDECVRDGKIKHGDLICIVGFGAGLTYGADVFEF